MKKLSLLLASLALALVVCSCQSAPDLPPSSAPEAPASSEAVSSEAPSEAVSSAPASSELVSSEAPPEPVSSAAKSAKPAPPASQKPTPPPPASIPEVKQNPETGDSLGNPSHVPPPSWDQPGADAEKEALALAQEYLLTLPSRDSNVASVAIEETSLSWNLKTAFGPTVTIEFQTTVVGSADSTSSRYPPGESKPFICEDYRLLPNGWEFLGEGIAYHNQDSPNPLT